MAINYFNNQVTGGRIALIFNGVAQAYASSGSYQHGIQYEEFRPVGTLEHLQLVPVSYSASVSLSGVALVGTNMTTLGLQPLLGNSAQEHLRNILAAEEIIVVFEDTITGSPSATAIGCRLSSNNTSFPSQAMSSGDYNFTARRILEFGN